MQLFSLKITRLYNDVNGNKKISVKHTPSGKYFHVQTNGVVDIPLTTPLKDWDKADHTAALSSFARYMYRCGTKHQKQVLKDVFNVATLSDVIRGNYTPSEEQKNSLFKLLAHGRRARTRERLEWRVKYGFSGFYQYGIYNRVHFEVNNTASYCAGQDYTAELSTVVECLTK